MPVTKSRRKKPASSSGSFSMALDGSSYVTCIPPDRPQPHAVSP